MKKFTCIVCPNGCELSVIEEKGKFLVEGNLCIRGREFAINEMQHPLRTVCSTVKTSYEHMPRLAVKISGEIPLEKIFYVMEEINKVVVTSPKTVGDIIVKNIGDLGVDLVATADMSSLIEEEKQ